jgi:hypothetical protein
MNENRTVCRLKETTNENLWTAKRENVKTKVAVGAKKMIFG